MTDDAPDHEPDPRPDRGSGDTDLTRLVDASPTGMALLDAELGLRHVNGRWTEFTGQSIDAALDNGWLDAIDADGRSDFVSAALQGLAEGRGVRGRLRLVTSNDDVRWIDLSMTPLGNSSGGALLTFDDITDELDEARRAHELTRVLEASPDLVAVLDSLGRTVVWANDAFQRFLPDERVAGSRLLAHLDGWSQARYAATALPAVRSGGTWRGELRLTMGQEDDSATLPVSAVLVAHRDAEERIEAISLVARDLSDLYAARQRVEATEVRLAALVEHASDLVCVVGSDGRIVYASPAIDRVLGLEPLSLEGVPIADLVHPEDLDRLIEQVPSVIATPGISPAFDARVAHTDGGWRHMEIVATNLLENQAVEGIVVNARDVTERVEVVAQLEERAFHDDLTGLPNRALLLERLQDALHRASRHQLSVGVLFLDLDRFKVVNDSLGHGSGDDLLEEVARRLLRTVRPGDTVARLGGDEFVVVIGDMIRHTDALAAAERIRRALSRPVNLGTESTVVSTSIGIAIAHGEESPGDLLRDADIAMYRAKEQGRDRAELFDDNLREQAVLRHSVEQELRLAIDANRIEVYFQPIVRIADGAIDGAEALARVRSERGELLLPDQFIDIAEDSGVIAELGSRVLVLALDRLAAWGRQTDERLTMAVNVSARQLADAAFPATVADALAGSGLDPARVALEFTESALIAENPITERVLDELTGLGVRIGLDDFGTGFSSLAYLKRFPIDFLKIDRSFVAGLGSNDGDTAIVTGIIALAHSMGLQVVAEGVETEEQLDRLRHLRCDLAQGYHFSEPVTDAEFDRFLGRTWTPSGVSPN